MPLGWSVGCEDNGKMEDGHTDGPIDGFNAYEGDTVGPHVGLDDEGSGDSAMGP